MNTRDPLHAIGLMSGTSADGIDAALVTIRREPRVMTLVHYLESPFPYALRARVLAAARGEANTAELCMLDTELGRAFGEAALAVCRAADMAPERVQVVGSHGQTVWHAPRADPPATLQLGCPAVIARAAGIPVVSNLRAADLACGGQGAPLAPLIHHTLFADAEEDRAIVNLGGIANVTWLPAGGGDDTVQAFDTGPANMVVDALAARYSQGGHHMDEGGARAARGRVHNGLLDDLLGHPYFSTPPPKSTGREMFGETYAHKLAVRADELGLSAEDTLATATALTARTVAAVLTEMGRPDRLLVCGGGAKNATLLGMLEQAMPAAVVEPVDRMGTPADALEAMAVADFACRHLWAEPGNLPQVTGADRRVVLGDYTPA